MRRAARIDSNQNTIVKQLRSIPGVTVATRHEDILIGFRGLTFWVELKNPDVIKKSGGFKAGAIKDSQEKLRNEWTGQYLIAWTIDQILEEIGVTKTAKAFSQDTK